MAIDSEQTFSNWAKPSSDTDAEKQANAERMIRDAIREDPALSIRQIDVFAQGSYRNKTKVRQESDVDICVCCRNQFFYEMAQASYTPTEVNIVPAAVGGSSSLFIRLRKSR
jgi:tRNA nucleotidyltransferase (CCA-adding enzyme)